jgi:hypothetical protein
MRTVRYLRELVVKHEALSDAYVGNEGVPVLAHLPLPPTSEPFPAPDPANVFTSAGVVSRLLSSCGY